MPQESIRVGKAELSAFVAAIFEAVGLSKEHAGEWARMLVWANLRGTDSHGIIRIPRYIDLVNAKSLAPRSPYLQPNSSFVRDVLDAQPGAQSQLGG